jgi:predicted ATPase
MQFAERIYSLAQEQDDSALMIGAYGYLASALYFSGDFETARQNAVRGVRIWRSGSAHFPVEDFVAPVVHCLSYQSLSEWHLGEVASCQTTMAEAISLAKQLHDAQASVYLLYWSAFLAYFEGNLAETERLASDLIEMATRQNIATWQPHGRVLRGWARCASGDIAEGISWIEDGIGDYRAAGAIAAMPFFLALKAQAFHQANRTCEALEAINEAEALVERSGTRLWFAELYRLRGVFLSAMGAEETAIEASFREAIRIAREQKSVSLEKRAEATYAEYRRQKASGSVGRGIRLPL